MKPSDLFYQVLGPSFGQNILICSENHRGDEDPETVQEQEKQIFFDDLVILMKSKKIQ